MLADQAVLMHIAMRAVLGATARYSVVAAARTVAAAEEVVSRARPGLLVCDADIGGQSGLDLCRRARRVSPATRVAILTSRNEPVLAKLAIAMNQLRLLMIVVLTVRFGYGTGFYWGHTLPGSLITIFGVALVFSVYILMVIRRKGRRPAPE
ncbi:MAG TPA: response regulator [Trebonia sp.]|nr:response regulator [Trebonia sp.]